MRPWLPISFHIPPRYSSVMIFAVLLLLAACPVSASNSFPEMSDKIELTSQEAEYLRQKKFLTMVVDPNWRPFDFVENGKHLGLGADYMRLISQRVGIPLKLLPTKNWTDSQAVAREGKCDIISMVNKTPEREKYLDFTDIYFSSQVVIIGRERTWLTKGLSELSGKRVVVGEGYWLEESIRRDFPDIRLLTEESPEDTFRMVAQGKAFATVSTLIEANHVIRQEAFADLRIIGQTDYQNDLRIGIRKGDKLLLQILQKGVHSFSGRENDAIFAKWASTPIEQPFNYSLLWKGLLVVAFVLAVFSYWTRKLFRLNRALKIAHAELAIKNEALERLSITDKLTGLFNRMKLDASLQHEIDRTLRYGTPLSIVLMDLDRFKDINDKLGHQRGDKVLQHVAAILRENVREVDIVGRWGGEEFLIICPNTDLGGAVLAAEHLRRKMEDCGLDSELCPSSSFGVTEFVSGDDEMSVLRKADEALYRAKENGRNRVETS